MDVIGEALDKIGYLSIPRIGIRDIIDILVVAFFFYKVLMWIKDTRTWALLKGVVIIIVIAVVAFVFQLHTVLWIISNAITSEIAFFNSFSNFFYLWCIETKLIFMC